MSGVPQPLVNDLIESAALVAPFKQTLVGSRAYFVIESRLSAGKRQVREFAHWLLAERRASDGASWVDVDCQPAHPPKADGCTALFRNPS
jgi:hypothetical protein